MEKKATIKQLMVLEAIEWFISENGISPTIQELADMLNSHPSVVAKKLWLLEEKGYIKTKNNKARSICVIRGVKDEETEN